LAQKRATNSTSGIEILTVLVGSYGSSKEANLPFQEKYAALSPRPEAFVRDHLPEVR
jgi:hypothetical protein